MYNIILIIIVIRLVPAYISWFWLECAIAEWDQSVGWQCQLEQADSDSVPYD